MQAILRASKRIDAMRHPLRAVGQLPRAGHLLGQASFLYGQAAEDLKRTIDAFIASPNAEFPAAAAALKRLSRRVAEVGARLADISDKLDARANEILLIGEIVATERPRFTIVRPIPPRAFLLHSNLAGLLQSLFQRRQRATLAAPEDAPRKVSRGRAPPLLTAFPS